MSDLQILAPHRVTTAILEVVHHAHCFAVLSSPYLRSWPHLDHAVQSAVARRVQLHLCVRSPDGTMQARQQQSVQIARMAAFGLRIHEVPRLHAKLYANESEAVLTSMNLVQSRQGSVELGVRITSPAMVNHLLEALSREVPVLQPTL
jgi:hypothetical protein